MRLRFVWIFVAAFVVACSAGVLAADKRQVLVVTDVENEPGEATSMVRFVTYAHQWDVEGLVATTSVHHTDKIAAWRISRPAMTIRWGADVLRQKPEWYASPEARAIADSVIQYQLPDGGWPKNTDLGVAPPPAQSRAAAGADVTSSTIDNNGTTMPMQFLALVGHATGEDRYRASFLRGFDYLLAAQYPNGGWPQFFPLRKGYYTRITFNDNAMVNVLTLLRGAAAGIAPYEFVDATRRTKAGTAVSRGIDIILKTQVKQDGKLTAWCAQHDEQTLAPAWGRAYEPPSLSGSESVGIVRFLMEIERPTPAIVAAIEGAAAWLRFVAIRGLRLETFTGADGQRDRRVVLDRSAGLLWARFYELGTNRPIFLGRDSVVHYALNEIERERRSGYAYYGQWPASLIDREVPRWRQSLRSPEVEGPGRREDLRDDGELFTVRDPETSIQRQNDVNALAPGCACITARGAGRIPHANAILGRRHCPRAVARTTRRAGPATRHVEWHAHHQDEGRDDGRAREEP
jgi:PelA/Pel-15E family pectate lyase